MHRFRISIYCAIWLGIKWIAKPININQIGKEHAHVLKEYEFNSDCQCNNIDNIVGGSLKKMNSNHCQKTNSIISLSTYNWSVPMYLS